MIITSELYNLLSKIEEVQQTGDMKVFEKEVKDFTELANKQQISKTRQSRLLGQTRTSQRLFPPLIDENI